MTQIIVDIPDDLAAKIYDAIMCGVATNVDDVVRKALRFFLGGKS